MSANERGVVCRHLQFAQIACVCLASLQAPRTGRADAPDDAGDNGSADNARAVLVEAAVGPAWFKGDPGVWVEAFAGWSLWPGDPTDIVLGLGLNLTQSSEVDEQDFDGDHVEDTETMDTLGFGVIGRGYLEHRFSTWFAGRIGIALGLAHIQMDSSYCGDVNATAMLYGVWGGPVFLLSEHFDVGLTADLVQYPRNACSPIYQSLTPNMPRTTAFRQAFFDPGDFDGTVTLLVRVGYRL